MNEFERALAKTDKREQRKTLTLPTAAEVSASWRREENATPTVAKEKRPSIDAVIHVTVTLPYETFELTLVKSNVVANVTRKPTKAEFRKAIADGLKPLLGSVT